jgi:hypothetical protein
MREGLRLVDGEDDAPVPVAGEVENHGALAVVDVQERPGAVLAEAAALRGSEQRRRVADPERECPRRVLEPDETAPIAVYGTRTSPTVLRIASRVP